VGQVFPRAGDTGNLGLTAKPSFGTDLTCDARNLRCKCIELVDHGVDGVLQLEDFALYIDGDFAREVAASDRRSHLAYFADLDCQIGRQQIDVVGQIFPCASHTGHDCLTTEAAFGADFTHDTRHFRGEGAQLVDHRVDGLLKLQDFTTHIDGYLFGEIA